MKSLVFLVLLLVFVSGCVSQPSGVDAVLRSDAKVQHFLGIFGDIAGLYKTQYGEEVTIEKKSVISGSRTKLIFELMPKNYPEKAAEIGYVVMEGEKIIEYSDSIEQMQQYSSTSDFANKWVQNVINTSKRTVVEKTNVAVSCSAAAIAIEDVSVNPSDKTATVIVRNSGQADLQIISANIYDTSGNVFKPEQTLPVTGFNRGSIRALKYTSTGMASCSSFSTAIVATDCAGVSATFSRTPKCV